MCAVYLYLHMRINLQDWNKLCIYLLWDVTFVMYGCQVTQDQFGSFSLSWSALSAVITEKSQPVFIIHLEHSMDIVMLTKKKKTLQIDVVFNSQKAFPCFKDCFEF